MRSRGKLVGIGAVLVLVASAAIVRYPPPGESSRRFGPSSVPGDQESPGGPVPASPVESATDLSPGLNRTIVRADILGSRQDFAARTQVDVTLVAPPRNEARPPQLRGPEDSMPEKKATSRTSLTNQPFHTFQVTRIGRGEFFPAGHRGLEAPASAVSDRRGGSVAAAPFRPHHLYTPWDALAADFYRSNNRSASGRVAYTAQYGLSLLRLLPAGRLELQGRVGDRNGNRFLSRGHARIRTFNGWQFDGGDKAVSGGGAAFLNPSIRGFHAERLVRGLDSKRFQAGASIGGASLNYENLEAGRYPRRMEVAFLRCSGFRDLGFEGAAFHLGDGNRKVTSSEAIRDGRGLGLSFSHLGLGTLLAGSVYASAFRFEDGGRQDGVEYSFKGHRRISRLKFEAAWQTSRGTAYRVGGYGTLQPATRQAVDGSVSARLAEGLDSDVWAGRWEQPRTRADRNQGTDGPLGSLEQARNRANSGSRWGGRVSWKVPRFHTDLSFSGESRFRVLDHGSQGIASYALSATQEMGRGRSASLRGNLLRHRGQASNRFLTGDVRLGLGAAGNLTLRQQTTWQEPVGPRVVSSGEISSVPFLAKRVHLLGRISQVHEEDRGHFLPAQTQVAVSARIRLGKGWGLSPYYQVTRYRAARVQTIQVSLTNAGDPVTEGIDRIGQEARPATRQLLGGVVFEDRNGDGLRQPTDRGIPGIAILIDNDSRNRVYTDNGGRYRTVLRPGNHLVGILAETIPAEYGLGNLAPVEIRVGVDDPARCDFHLERQNCAIVGRVVRPRVADMALPNGISPEGGVAGVTVLLNEADFTYTDANGYFTFRPLASGTYQVRIDTASLPFGHLVQDSPVQEVMVDDSGSGEAACLFTISRSVRRSRF